MKKKILLATTIALLVCLFAFGIDAKVVNSEDSSTRFNFGDTLLINGSPYTEYFYFNVPYDGTVKFELSVEGSSRPADDILYIIYIQKYGYDYTGGYRYNVEFPQSDYTTNKVIRRTLPKGEYYILVGGFSLSMWSWTSDYHDLYMYTSFECSHIDTEEVTVQEATCNKNGLIEERCTACKDVIEEYEIEKLAHTPESEWTITKETSCAEAGERVKYCTVCDEEAEVEEIEALDHTWTDWTVTKEATCAEEGSKYRTCSVCEYKNEREIESPEHNWTEWEIVEEQSCEKEGLKTRSCSECKYEEEVVIEKDDHRFGNWKTTDEATETSKGERERTCKDCKYVETEVIDKLVCGDETSWKTTKAATCTSNGTKAEVCDYCGKTLDTATIYAEGHEWDEWKITRVPTKSRNGEKMRECLICEETEEKSVTLTHGDYGEWEITQDATCTDNGKKEFICDCCGKSTDTETIKKTGHKFEAASVTKDAAPERKGEKTAKCQNCDETQIEYIDYDFEELKKAAKKNHFFTDVSDSNWFGEVVGNCYHYGLMVGTSETTFNPSGNITRAEVITSAVRIYCLYNSDEDKPEMGTSPWYKGYVDYSIEKGIIKADDFTDYTVPATRAEMAYIFTNAVGEENLEKINDITSIPDVNAEDMYANEIFMLYNAGVLTGSDAMGTFNPTQNIVRSESAAIIARISRISDRVKK